MFYNQIIFRMLRCSLLYIRGKLFPGLCNVCAWSHLAKRKFGSQVTTFAFQFPQGPLWGLLWVHNSPTCTANSCSFHFLLFCLITGMIWSLRSFTSFTLLLAFCLWHSIFTPTFMNSRMVLDWLPLTGFFPSQQIFKRYLFRRLYETCLKDTYKPNTCVSTT